MDEHLFLKGRLSKSLKYDKNTRRVRSVDFFRRSRDPFPDPIRKAEF
jgi:hypothetical protein